MSENQLYPKKGELDEWRKRQAARRREIEDRNKGIDGPVSDRSRRRRRSGKRDRSTEAPTAAPRRTRPLRPPVTHGDPVSRGPVESRPHRGRGKNRATHGSPVTHGPPVTHGDPVSRGPVESRPLRGRGKTSAPDSVPSLISPASKNDLAGSKPADFAGLGSDDLGGKNPSNIIGSKKPDDVSNNIPDKPEKSATEKAEKDSLYKGLGGFSDYKNIKQTKSGRKAIRGKFSLKQRARMSIASAFLTFLIGIGGIGGAFAVGPGELIMFGENFKDFSFGVEDQQSEDLTNRLYRRIFVKNPGDRELGAVGRKTANTVQNSLKKNGVEFVTDNRGNLTGIKENGRLTFDLSDSRLGVRGDTGFRNAQAQRRSAMRVAIKRNGVSNWKYYTTYKPLMQTRFRVRFQAFENVDRKARVEADKWYRERFRKQVVEGDTELNAEAKSEDQDADDAEEEKRRAEAAEEGKNEVDKGIEDNKELTSAELEDGVSPRNTRSATVKSLKLGAGGLLSVAGVTSLACTVQSIDDNIDEVAYLNRYVPLVRLFNFFMSMDDQVKSFDIASMGEIQEAVKLLRPPPDSPRANTSWITSAPAALTVGAPTAGLPDIRADLSPDPNSLAQGLSLLSGVLDKLPGLDLGCSFTSSTLGQWTMSVVDFALSVSGPASLTRWVASEILTNAFADDILNAIVSVAQGPALDLASFDHIDTVGGVLAGGIASVAEVARAEGGRELTREESTERRAAYIESRQQAFAKLPMQQRLFDYTHPDSLISYAVPRAPKNRHQFVAAISHTPVSMLERVAKMMSPTIRAQAENYCSSEEQSNGRRADGTNCANSIEDFDNYGIQDYGFTEEEIERIKQYNPDDLVAFAEGQEDSAGKPGLDSETRNSWEDCFVGGDTDSANGWADYCQEAHENDNERFLKFRGGLKYGAIIDGHECAESNTCGSGSANANEQTSSSGLPTGDSQELAKQILESGKVSGNSRYISQIQAVADGDNSCNVNPTVLQLLAALSKSYSFYISSLNRKCTGSTPGAGTRSYHYRDGGGHAVDIAIVDGQPSTGGTSQDLELIGSAIGLLPSGSGIGQSNCRNSPLSLPDGVREFRDSCNHIHIQVPIQ